MVYYDDDQHYSIVLAHGLQLEENQLLTKSEETYTRGTSINLGMIDVCPHTDCMYGPGTALACCVNPRYLKHNFDKMRQKVAIFTSSETILLNIHF